MRVILVALHNAWFTTVPLKPLSYKKNVENKIVFLSLIPLFCHAIHAWSDKAFNGNVVDRALASLHGGSLEITLTVPLMK